MILHRVSASRRHRQRNDVVVLSRNGGIAPREGRQQASVEVVSVEIGGAQVARWSAVSMPQNQLHLGGFKLDLSAAATDWILNSGVLSARLHRMKLGLRRDKFAKEVSMH